MSESTQDISGQRKIHMEKGLLQAYFERIGYEGDGAATVGNLRIIHRLHPQSIPFENLNPFLRVPVLLEDKALQQKLVHDQRGGYCFEHNLFFGKVLQALGFHVRGLAARIMWNAPEGTITPRGHMLLLVEAEGRRFIADVGFGGLTLTAPLLLEPGTEQETPHEPFRLIKDDDQYILQTKVREEWKAIYRFGLEEQFLQDYEVTNWYLSNHPESHFVTGVIAARSAPGVRYALRNNQLSIHHMDGLTEKNILKDPEALMQVLQETFLIRLPEADVLKKELLARIFAGD